MCVASLLLPLLLGIRGRLSCRFEKNYTPYSPGHVHLHCGQIMTEEISEAHFEMKTKEEEEEGIGYQDQSLGQEAAEEASEAQIERLVMVLRLRSPCRGPSKSSSRVTTTQLSVEL